jgi:outer membrane protein
MALVVAEQLIRVREQSVAQARTQLQQARAAFQAGTVPQADVLRAESQVATAEFDLLDAQTQAEVRRNNLRTLLVLDPLAPVAVGFPGSLPVVDVGVEEAARRAGDRAEIKRAEADVRASEAGLAAAMLQGGVTATVNGSYVLLSAGGSGSTGSTGLNASLVLTLPVYEGGRNAAAVEVARGALDNQKALLEQLRQTLRQEAINARFQNATANARLEAAQRAAAAARESLRVAEGRFAAGVGTILEVTTARTEAVAAEQTLLQVAADRYTTAVVLRRALGMTPLP